MKKYRHPIKTVQNMILWKQQICLYSIIALTHAIHPEVNLNFQEKAKRHGYPVEIHQVISDDDYILTIYRIPHGTQETEPIITNKSVVVLLHGMGGSPNNWIAIGRKNALPYYLADRGFDVWLICSRGVRGAFDKRHKYLDWNKDQDYWDFSLEDIALHDLKAHLDYVTSHTNQSKVFYVGHSAACPQFFILMSEMPEYNDKIKLGVHYASSPIIKRMDYPVLQLLCWTVDIVRGVMKYLNLKEFLPIAESFRSFIIAFCNDPKFKKVCVAGAWAIGSHKSYIMDEDLVGILAGDQPSRLSNKQMFHFMDNVNSGDFRKYNYGTKKNLQIYGEKLPPRYNLANCTAPVAFFYGLHDGICVRADVLETMNLIPNVVLDYEVPYDKFNHIDFIFARNATELVYEPTYKLFRDFDDGFVPASVGKRSVPEDD